MKTFSDNNITKDTVAQIVSQEVTKQLKPLNVKFNILAGVVIGTVVFWALIFGTHFINA